MEKLIYKSPIRGPRRFADWLNRCRNFSGAYVIRERSTGTVLYVGESHTGNMAKTIKRHFFRWNDSTDRQHFTADPRSVEVAIRVTPPNAAIGAQNNLIERLKPLHNVVGNSDIYEGFSPFDAVPDVDPF